MPLPGVTVSAANTLTGKKAVTSTEPDGSYRLELSARGRYVVRAEMTAFAPATQEVLLKAEAPEQRADFTLVLLSRAPKPEESGPAAAAAALGTVAREGRGTQRLSLTVDGGALSAANDTENGVPGEPALGGLAALVNSPDATNQSVNFAGQTGETPDFLRGARTSDELRERFQQMGDQRGFGPGGGSPLAALTGGGPFVLRRNRLDINQPHGTFYYSAGNSALNASSYALNGRGGANPGYSSNRFGGVIGGPLNIPHIIDDKKTFFFGGYTGTRATNPYVDYSNVPTSAELDAAAVAAHNLTPSPIAQSLLNDNYYPAPNFAGSQQNYRFASATQNDTDNLFLRITHNFGSAGSFRPFGGGGGGGRGGMRARNNLNFNFNWLRGNTSLPEPFPTVGGTTHNSSFNTGLGWAAGKGNWNNILRVNFNRARTITSNLYAGVSNVEQGLGIPTGISSPSFVTPSANPSDWGLPNISITGFTPLTDVAPQYRNDSTLQFSESVIRNRNKHNIRFGGDFRRLWTTLNSNANPRGSYTFTGFATNNPLGDFLAGVPQSTALQYSSTPYYFSTDSYDLFVMDDWHVRSNLTLQAGLRYEYIAPYTEANDRLVNLDLQFAPGLTGVTCVTPTLVTGCGLAPYNGLMKPDRNNFAPRVGFAWKVQKNTVVRGGYGINYSLSEYGTVITQLAYQPPFAVSMTPIASTAGALTLSQGFPVTANAVTNSYAVDPNYHLPYVQIWNLNIQREFGTTLLVNIGYNGSKGTDLDVVTAPNRTPTGLLLPNVQPFEVLTSQGSSILHAGSLRVRKRLSHGLAVGGTYVFSKSIDDASSIGGGSVVVAQNPLNLAAERGLSSFDQRHKLTGDFLYELPFGSGKRWLTRGPLGRAFGDWTVSSTFTIASGMPFTPYVGGSIIDVGRGSSGSLRPNLVPGQPTQLANPSTGEWFNTAAFVAAPPGQYGDAGRDIIIGPGTVLFNASVAKTFPFKETKSLEFRVTANNVLNHANFSGIDTNLNSPSFGQVTSVQTMRQLLFLSRFRF